MSIPKRGFEVSEYENRLNNIQKHMFESKMDAILLTTQVDIEYYTGFKSQFFQSPTRPWYVLIPGNGKPKAIIPTIGESGMRGTWIDDIQTWTSPNPEDDGISLLLQTIKSLMSKHKCLGVPKTLESTLRMPLDDYEYLIKSLVGIEIKDANKILRKVRFVKSPSEIAKIRHICQITSQGFIDLEGFLSAGDSEQENCRRFKQHLLSLGVDDSPYIVSGSGKDGYGSIIMGPTDKLIEEGDLFIIDTGSVFDSYYCDFDRNYAFGHISEESKSAYRVAFDATEAGFKAAQVGNTTSDIFNAMNDVLQKGGALGSTVGRLGHGLGMQLTEWPSNTASDNTVLEPGVVLTLEPGMEFLPGKEMVHEENIVITDDGPEWLSIRAAEELPIIQ
ncbi:Xaa-Pro peptidase family protein [Candidatus Thioglobus sp. NP1]|uniref:M24 family metallopeptidase n=1 Tax=Candidatus Thioglobus sp. NP1 TaxID=2508687 RepID=UPI000DED9A14|nr:Xaa-Pro peptidase family protein [Candidatus Thioglobus sp. NP1]AXE61867.1 peptidase M24 [Candidatus Thioglobus sp. NP1]